MIILPFKDIDEDLLYTFSYDGVESDISGNDVIDIVKYYSRLGQSYVAVTDNRIIGIGGVYKLWKDWGGCWLFLNKEAYYHKICIFKGIIDRMNDLIKLYEIKMLTVQCLDNSMEAHRLLNHLGFVKSREVKMSLYGRKV